MKLGTRYVIHKMLFSNTVGYIQIQKNTSEKNFELDRNVFGTSLKGLKNVNPV